MKHIKFFKYFNMNNGILNESPEEFGMEYNICKYYIKEIINEFTNKKYFDIRRIDYVGLDEKLIKLFRDKVCEFFDLDDGSRIISKITRVYSFPRKYIPSQPEITFRDMSGNFHKVDYNKYIIVYFNRDPKDYIREPKESVPRVRWYKKGKLENDK